MLVTSEVTVCREGLFPSNILFDIEVIVISKILWYKVKV